jgi:hypothetical protein
MYDEEDVLPIFVERMRPVLDSLGISYELVVVDDGSRDQTAALLTAAARDWHELRLVRLLRNSGHQAALSAGFRRARGEYVVTIDADLQDPPEVVAELLAKARDADVDVVYGVRSDRSSDTWAKRTSARLYYRLMCRLVGQQIPFDAGDFRLVSRRRRGQHPARRRPGVPPCHPVAGVPQCRGEVRPRRAGSRVDEVQPDQDAAACVRQRDRFLGGSAATGNVAWPAGWTTVLGVRDRRPAGQAGRAKHPRLDLDHPGG